MLDDAYSDLLAAGSETGERGEYLRYRALTDALERCYAVDSSLNVLWRSLKRETRERLSAQTDERARRAAEHNADGRLPFNLETDYAFVGYVRRLSDQEPYRHWGELLMAGLFQGLFFQAIGWVRGQLIHAAASAPLDLRQPRLHTPAAQLKERATPLSDDRA